MLTSLFSMKNKTVFIIGSSSGLGQYFAIILAKAGADVVLAARRTDKLEALAEQVRNLSQKAFVVNLDVTHFDSIQSAVEQAFKLAGQIDVLINCAGNPPFKKEVLDYSELEWDALINTHLKGAWLVAQAVAKQMIRQQQPGVIINIASTIASHTRKGGLVYGVAKAGVSYMTKALALELAPHKIRVNALAPGWFVTDFNRDFLATALGQEMVHRIPLRRTGELQELEGPLLLLASDASGYMTGSILEVDGGCATNQI